MIPNKLKLIALVGLTLMIGLLLHKCNVDPKPNPTDIKLNADDQAKIIVDKNKITVVKRDKNGNAIGETKFIPDHATVIYKKNGEIEFKVQQLGFQFEPGIGVIGVDRTAALSLDVQFAYWKRIGFNAGVGVQIKSKPSAVPFVAASYRLPFNMISNTSLMLGYAPVQKSAVAGLRIRF